MLSELLGQITNAITQHGVQNNGSLNAGSLISDVESLFMQHAANTGQQILPASRDPYGDPGGGGILPASADPYGDPGGGILPASADPYGDPANQRRQ